MNVTVQELIEALSKLNPDDDVAIATEDSLHYLSREEFRYLSGEVVIAPGLKRPLAVALRGLWDRPEPWES